MLYSGLSQWTFTILAYQHAGHTKTVNALGGMRLMKDFIDKAGVRPLLDGLGLPQGRSNRSCDPAVVVEAFMLNIWIGASRFCHCDGIREDAALKEIFGFKAMPSQSACSRFFGKFTQGANNRVFPELQHWTMAPVDAGALTIGFDSTVITRSGGREGSARGCNPNRHGRNSHHPLMAFASQTRMVANAWLRPGSTAACSNCEAFMEETFGILRERKVGLARADSGFSSEKTQSYLEGQGLDYIIAVRAIPRIKSEIYAMKQWVEICEGIEAAEFEYGPLKGTRRRRIVVRKLIERRPESCGKLLFEDLPQYRYSVHVANLELPPEQIWKICNGRADCENRIKELKGDFGLDSFCLHDFWATERPSASLCSPAALWRSSGTWRSTTGKAARSKRFVPIALH